TRIRWRQTQPTTTPRNEIRSCSRSSKKGGCSLQQFVRRAPARQRANPREPCLQRRPFVEIDAGLVGPEQIAAARYVSDRRRSADQESRIAQRERDLVAASGFVMAVEDRHSRTVVVRSAAVHTTMFTILFGTTTIFFGAVPPTYFATSGLASAVRSMSS